MRRVCSIELSATAVAVELVLLLMCRVCEFAGALLCVCEGTYGLHLLCSAYAMTGPLKAQMQRNL